MGYQVLARKWRPQTFNDLVGQEPILRMLTNALEQQRLHHAYLFTGTRGVGKTTLARLLVKCLNCESGITATPCETCATCQAIQAGRFLDLQEVDAASRTKVEDTRDLLENVLYPPTQGRYKVYLIDEVHMLSNHSFNALLKTLEEPPAHVKFLLATTDPKRLPITILSRCLQFHLKPISAEQISRQLQLICTTEKIAYDVLALEKIARAAEGSMRDALSLLDQAIAFGNGTVTLDDIHTMLGSIAREDLLPLLEALAAQNAPQVFAALALLSERSPDCHQVLAELIEAFHHLALQQVIGNNCLLKSTLTSLVNAFSPEDIQIYYQIALLGRRDLSLAPTPWQGLEMTLLRMLAFQPSKKNKNTVAQTQLVTPIIEQKQTEKIITPEIIATTLNEWRDLLPKLQLSGMAQALAANCSLQQMTENKVILTLSALHQPMLHQKCVEKIEEALIRHLQRTIKLEVNLTSAEIFTPLKQHQQEKASELAQATETILQDTFVQKLIATYDATVEVSLLS
jgi:DNA polymerase-3 subunit gamma/tau